MIIGDIADGLTRGVERTVSTVSEAFFEPVVGLGVTGLSRAGKTVFITSLVANLIDRGRMPGLAAAASGAIRTAYLQPQPDDTVPRFDYEAHLAAMTGPDPHWPDGTRSISELRLSLRVQPGGLLGGLRGERTVHLDIVDYPGEWLLDLSLLDRDFRAWSDLTLGRAASRPEAEEFLAALGAADPAARLDEAAAKALAQAYSAYLEKARAAGYSDCTPGRFLLPGELAGSPALTFAPLRPGEAPRGSLAREFARRYEAYKREVVKPFFRDHFARVDRQVVLVDVLGAIHAGPRAVEDLRAAMADILAAFRPGRNRWLASVLLGRRVERILFAATKADHLHHTQHARLTAIMEALLADAKRRADFAGAETAAMSIAALRATTEDTLDHDGRTLDVVRGTLENGRNAAFYPGALPDDPGRLLAPAREGAERWLDADYAIMTFRPAEIRLRPGEGPPHIRLDRAAEFLIGDRLRMSWRLDEAQAADAAAMGAILSDWIDGTLWMPRLHTEDEDRAWCRELTGAGQVRLLRGPGGVAGFLAREGGYIPALYVAAPWRGQGFGKRLLDDAKALSPGRLWLWTFQANDGARRFWRREGFREAELTDGADNDERLPDMRLVWEAG